MPAIILGLSAGSAVAQVPAPVITGFSPTSVTQNHLLTNFNVQGSNFQPGDIVFWSVPGASAPTVYQFTPTNPITGATTALIINLSNNAPGPVGAAVANQCFCSVVVVHDQAHGGANSNVVGINVNSPPTLLSLSQTGIAAGSASFPLTVSGIFGFDVQVTWNGSPRATTNTSDGSPEAIGTILASDVVVPGTYNVSIVTADGLAPTNPASLPFTVTQYNASGTLTSNVVGGNIFYGVPVTLTAVFSPPSGVTCCGVPTGTVTFFNQTTNTALGLVNLDATGTAVLNTVTSSQNGFAPGTTNFIQARWPGDSNFFPPDGTPNTFFNVGPSVTLTASPNTLAMSATATVTYTATVVAGPSGAFGPVVINDGGTPITNGSGTCANAGNQLISGPSGATTMSCTVIYDGSDADRAEGSHSMTATYAFLGGGVSAAQTVTVTAATPAIGTPVSSAGNSLVAGQTTAISVNVTGLNPPNSFRAISGTVNFFLDNSNTPLNPTPITLVTPVPPCSLVALTNCQTATLPAQGFPVGNHTITARYLGNAPGSPGYLPVTSQALALQVGQGATTATVSPASNTMTFGIGDVLTATVTVNAPGAGTPTGNVVFRNGTTPLSASTQLNNGTATYTLTTALAPGTYTSINVNYLGDTNFAGSTSIPATVTVNQNSTTGTLTTSPAGTSTYAQPVTLTATFTPANGGLGTPGGGVTFRDATANVQLGLVALNASGVATLTTTAITPGVNKTITATWAGDVNFTAPASAPSATLTVNAATPTVTLTPSPATVPMGTGAASTVTYSVVVNGGAASGSPTGTIVINDGGTPVSAGAGTCAGGVALIPGDGASGVSCTMIYNGSTADRSTGVRLMTATYTPNGQSAVVLTAATSSQQTETVTGATATIGAPVANPGTLVAGQATVLSVTVTGILPATAFNTLTGSVTFLDGNTALNATPIALTVNGNVGTASLPARSFTAGPHNITVQYSGSVSGSPGYAAGTGPALGLGVGRANTTTTLTPAAATITSGQSVLLTASVAVTVGTGIPTGTVSFMLGSQVLGTAGLVNGVATFNLSTSASTPFYAITATYNGDANDNPSTSGVSTITATSPTVFSIPFPTSLAAGTVGVPYSASFGATGGNGTITWSLSGALPDGITFSSSGTIGGTPNVPGTFGFSVTATDSTGATASRGFSLLINPATLVVTGSAPSTATIGDSYSLTFGATGGVQPYNFSVNGTLPPGTSVSGNTISGTLNATGTFAFSVTVTDKAGTVASKSFSLTVGSPTLAVPGGALPDGIVGSLYSATVGATGGTKPYKFSGTAPDGLTVGTDGTVSGTPTTVGQSSVSVTVTDATGAKATGSYTINIVAPLVITPNTLADAVVGSSYSATVTATGGTKPYTFNFTATPDGISGHSDGTITGTPTTAGPGTISVTVKDAANRSLSKSYSITIAPPALLLTLSAGNGTVGTAYSASATASGGTKPYTYSATGLPAGVSIDSASGAISGTPSAAGTTTIAVTVKDGAGKSASASASVSITLPPTPPVGFTGVSGTGTPGSQQNVGLTLSNPYPVDMNVTLTLTFAADSGPDDPTVVFSSGGRTAHLTIPAGATSSLTNVGVQIGTVAGTITITAQLLVGTSDVTPSPAPKSTIRINAAPPTITSATATRNANGFTVVVVGFVPDREITSVTFTFNPAPGSTLQTTTLTIAVDTVFGPYFSGPGVAFGSQFTFTQPFNVQGNATIASVTITMVNKLGNSNSITVNLQ